MVQQTASPHKVSEPIGPDSPVSTSACQSQPPANMHAPTHLISRQIGLNNTLLIRLWVQMPEIEKPMELDAPACHIGLSENGRLLTITGLSGSVSVYGFPDLIPHCRWPLHSPVPVQETALAQVGRTVQRLCYKWRLSEGAAERTACQKECYLVTCSCTTKV